MKTSSSNLISRSEVDLMNRMRNLWEQHAFWTKIAVTSLVMKLPNEEATVNRLLRNPRDFARTLNSYYGSATALMFQDLLTEHLELAAKMINELLAGDTAQAEETKRQWYKNADAIANFLGSINPNWSKMEWRQLFYKHLEQIQDLVAALMNKNYVAAVNITDELEAHALVMADTMAKGIIKQFPRRFPLSKL